MTLRKFTVYIDDVSTVKPQPAPKPAPAKAPEEAGLPSLSATEKENLHPLTGGRLRSSSTVGLKRKSSVLATKLHNPPGMKDSKQTQSQASFKKRKVTSSSDGEIERSRPKARRLKLITRRTRSPELASIAEEKDERLARRLSQSDVDSRCYDLTVSPLANVSDAFAQIPPSAPKHSKTAAAAKRTGSVEPDLRDHVRSPADAIVAAAPSTPVRRSTRGTSLPPPILSTPERKRIYASFTFSSPIRGSPERKRKRPVGLVLGDLPAVL